ncbi:MAG: L-seryl-tRNA(Sec) selenium transferase [Desulfomonile tiedjei]|uniref:L-seryl-tRNA(Sec) selenium transferase n=1 Tax=Desulfomonile tiedjei TaxID=2358 RepID=A0A9D6Z2Z9_9BACT|nr:L-seryl-tRNA(Sec) selenium transferase [Desulfomonile tiedjei]
MEQSTLQEKLRLIPAVDKLMADRHLAVLKELYSDEMVKRVVRAALDELRKDVSEGKASQEDFAPEALAIRAERILQKRVGKKLVQVINATGVIVHTNLGRSPLSSRVAERIAQAAMSYSNLEYNLERGHRGERNAHLRQIMLELTGAEAVLAVNNNAAAVLLALDSLASGKEVIVSRGELIEIGGSFRIPDVMARSGAILREVGTTNRTHPKDYIEAINENTALILKVHTSNYRIVGFTREVELDELVSIGREKGIPTMMDLGSGCLVNLSPYGLQDEPTVQEILALGVDVVSFSGDKLLGGPQAGILAGRAEFVEKMRTNPLARALRMDKLTLAALEATFEEYVRAEGPAAGIPTLDMITRAPEKLAEDADGLAAAINTAVGERAYVGIEPGIGRVGGGALPMGDLPGPRVSIRPWEVSAARLERELRSGDPAIIALVKDDTVLIDPRTLLHDQASLIPGLVIEAFDRCQASPDRK